MQIKDGHNVRLRTHQISFFKLCSSIRYFPGIYCIEQITELVNIYYQNSFIKQK
jgi:hypothetical protein